TDPQRAAAVVEKRSRRRFPLQERRGGEAVDKAGCPIPPVQRRIGALDRADPEIRPRVLVDAEDVLPAKAPAPRQYFHCSCSLQTLEAADRRKADDPVPRRDPPAAESILKIDLVPAPSRSANGRRHRRMHRREAATIEMLGHMRMAEGDQLSGSCAEDGI